jgi:PhoPQ-activated pathogenicity-related protein
MLAKNESKNVGRPSSYNHTIAIEICNAISTSTRALKDRCLENSHWPHIDTIYSWLWANQEFAELYARAKQYQAQLMADEIVSISDDMSQDIVYDEDGRPRQNNEFIARSRLRVDARKWVAAKLLPRIYGDKIQSEVTIVVKHEDALSALE